MLIAILSLICLFIGYVLIYYAVFNYRAQRNAYKYGPSELQADKKMHLGFLRALVAHITG